MNYFLLSLIIFFLLFFLFLYKSRYSDTKDKVKESLDMLVNQESVISFPRGNLYRSFSLDGVHLDSFAEETYFDPETAIGSKRADRIKVH